jgi:hypothetical protein|tara:strand:- start:274 stop:549 length:276 start_codon:yes stop_codon:yes gene_type:complete
VLAEEVVVARCLNLKTTNCLRKSYSMTRNCLKKMRNSMANYSTKSCLRKDCSSWMVDCLMTNSLRSINLENFGTFLLVASDEVAGSTINKD